MVADVDLLPVPKRFVLASRVAARIVRVTQGGPGPLSFSISSKEPISDVTTAPWPSVTGGSPNSGNLRGLIPPRSGDACDATHRIVASWPGGYQGQVTIRAGRTAINGWTVSWTLPADQRVTRIWNGTLTTSGSAVSVRNASYNGSLPATACTTFGFTVSGEPSDLALTCTTP